MKPVKPLKHHRDHIGEAWDSIEKDRKSGMYTDDERKIQAANDNYLALVGEKVNELIERFNQLLSEKK